MLWYKSTAKKKKKNKQTNKTNKQTNIQTNKQKNKKKKNNDKVDLICIFTSVDERESLQLSSFIVSNMQLESIFIPFYC